MSTETKDLTATDLIQEPVKRRDFLKVLGVGGAAATAVGCYSDQVEKLIP